jgi:tRNA A-37 threonylcarbamoyl transferase component Bud32
MSLVKDAPNLTEYEKFKLIVLGEVESADTSFAVLELPGNNVLSATQEIDNYTELNPNYYHQLSSLVRIPNVDDDSNVYFVGEDIVLKYVTGEDEGTVEDFYREIIVGLEVNRLQSPNFIQTVGFVTSDECLVPGLTDPGATCIYLYLERIRGPTLAEYITVASYQNVVTVLLDLVKAYLPAYKYLGFTHYDLHLRNIMVKTVDGKDIPVFIDFGAAHISLPHGDLGVRSILSARYNDRSMWTQDFFKVFGMLWTHTSLDLLNVLLKRVVLNVCEITGSKLRKGEKFLAFVERMVKSRKQIPLNLVNYITELKSDIDKLSTDRMQALNQFAFEVLKYFNPDLSIRWLLEYWDLDPYWGSYPTPLGEREAFEPFLEYVSRLAAQQGVF